MQVGKYFYCLLGVTLRLCETIVLASVLLGTWFCMFKDQTRAFPMLAEKCSQCGEVSNIPDAVA